ncbi:XdhC family protein [Lachnoanaerobaculum orale]|uniref:XdhC family protein n=1 Tax=Lachnoanaerobaculum orale TaxID=979627 RepID=UPI0023A7EFBA|nr:XdhC family protein [Lachnoanaerobaculum orale]
MDKELYKIIDESKKKGLRTFVFTSLGDKDYGSKAVLQEGKLVWISPETSFFKDNFDEIKNITKAGITEIAGNRVYVEHICNVSKIVICGAGHTSIALIKMGQMIGCEMIVIEDREEFAAKAKDEGADRVYCEDFSSALKKFDSDYDTYFVVVTRGHQWDKECIREILKKPYAYVGLMGAKRRVGFVLDAIRSEGYPEEKIEEIYTPIGLDIKSETPAEIAISILAEIISVKNSKTKNVGYVEGMLEKIKESNERMVMATIVDKKGSAPRGVGAKALFLRDGSFIGTIGGGKAEHDIMVKVDEVLKSDEDIKPYLLHVNLTDSEASLEGMVCGGRIEVLIEPV